MPTFLGTNSNDTVTPSLVTPGVDAPPNTRPGSGNDTIYGWAGLDKLDGGGGNDLLFGGLDADLLTGGTGDDWLYGEEGNDTLKGGANNDTLDGGTGNDSMLGGDGDDTYVVDSASDIVVEQDTAAGGNDVVQSSVSWTLGIGLERLVLTGLGAISGTGNAGNNAITGNGMANKLDGGLGNDSLYGGDGNDSLDGGSGSDLLDGGIGDDSMRGGDGSDTYYVDSVGDLVVESVNTAVGGIDLVYSSLSHTLGFGVENLVLTGTSAINGTGNDSGNTIEGNSAANYLSGLAGIDKLIGGGGNDTLDGGTGADVMYGDGGDDLYIVDDIGDIAQETTTGAAGGFDTVWASASHTLGANLENLRLIGTAAINGTGNDLGNVIQGTNAANTIFGHAGDDIIEGLSGSDSLVGGSGNDMLYGGIGKDTLRGEDGNDLLAGEQGTDDVLIGGLGADLFVWTIASSIGDIIRGGDGAIAFEGAGTAAGDLIVLAQIDADTTVTGNQAFVFGGSGKGQLQVVDEGANSVVLANMDDDADFEFRLVIEDGGVFAIAYTADDFVL